MPDRWTETVPAGTVTTSSRTSLLVCAHAHDGMPYIEITNFVKVPDSHQVVARQRIVLPASRARELAQLLLAAAEKARTMKGIVRAEDLEPTGEG